MRSVRHRCVVACLLPSGLSGTLTTHESLSAVTPVSLTVAVPDTEVGPTECRIATMAVMFPNVDVTCAVGEALSAGLSLYGSLNPSDRLCGRSRCRARSHSPACFFHTGGGGGVLEQTPCANTKIHLILPSCWVGLHRMVIPLLHLAVIHSRDLQGFPSSWWASLSQKASIPGGQDWAAPHP